MWDFEQKVTRLGHYNFVSCDSANVTVFAIAPEISLLNQAFSLMSEKVTLVTVCYSSESRDLCSVAGKTGEI